MSSPARPGPITGSAWFGQTHRPAEPARAGNRAGRHRPQVPEADGVREPHACSRTWSSRSPATSGVWQTLFAKLSGEQRDRIDRGAGARSACTDAARHAAPAALSHGQKQWLEIGMLLMQNPRLLLVDEPVAGMTPQEVERTAELLTVARRRALGGGGGARHGVRALDRAQVTVLHQGSVLAEGSMDEMQANPQGRRSVPGRMSHARESRASTSSTAAATSCGM